MEKQKIQRKQEIQGRQKIKRRQRIKRRQITAVMFTLSLLMLLILAVGAKEMQSGKRHSNKKKDATIAANAEVTEDGKEEEDTQAVLEMEKAELIAQADKQADSYDYDNAVALLKTWKEYDNETLIMEKIADYEERKASCAPANMEEVTHIFYHSLVVDPERAFANHESSNAAKGNNQWMTTVSEFNKITQEMYDRGYVLVSVHDLVEVTRDEDGNETFKAGTIMLPPDKKPFVMSLDDLSYYHSYDNYGYASRLILDEEGNPVCEYVQEDGTTVVGAYDVVPLLDQFVKEHPDAAYRGAKGIIALTGYNGILGYRTDISYEEVADDINADKKEWLNAHPEFNLKKEREEAKKVADAMKEKGWEFASHTWGHLRVGKISRDHLATDTNKWKENVEPLVGATDTIIFAHGEDLGPSGDYDADNPKFQYLKEQGYSIFCNVDSTEYGTWFGRDYMRQTRRNLDGYRIYYNAIGVMDSLSDLFDAKEILDPLRPPVMPIN